MSDNLCVRPTCIYDLFPDGCLRSGVTTGYFDELEIHEFALERYCSVKRDGMSANESFKFSSLSHSDLKPIFEESFNKRLEIEDELPTVSNACVDIYRDRITKAFPSAKLINASEVPRNNHYFKAWCKYWKVTADKPNQDNHTICIKKI